MRADPEAVPPRPDRLRFADDPDPPRGEEQFIGVDVGGTKVAVRRLVAGELVTSRRATEESAEAMIEAIAGAVESVRTAEVAAVGVGIPSVVDFETGPPALRSTFRWRMCRFAPCSASGSASRLHRQRRDRRGPGGRDQGDGGPNLVMLPWGRKSAAES